jgi:hypothetical protein
MLLPMIVLPMKLPGATPKNEPTREGGGIIGGGCDDDAARIAGA